MVALREEERAIEPGLAGLRAEIARTGIGKRNARERTEAFADRVKPAIVVVTGFAGALRPGLEPGAIVVAAEVREASVPEARWPAPQELLEKASRLSFADASVPTVTTGTLVTADRVLSSAEAKRRLGEDLAADAVDIETSGALRALAERGVPALCVRAIVDEADYDLPLDFGKILGPDGRFGKVRTLGALLLRPAALPGLFELRARVQAAERALGAFVPRLVEALS
ncbi:MAG: hypothetical protein HY721_04600 [Planctomycetes bacterium]|nr:hypothetical protein [Planctomycetota bacterium]